MGNSIRNARDGWGWARPPHGQHRVSEIEIFFTPKMLHISVLYADFKQNNSQTTLTLIYFDFRKGGIHPNLVILLNKLAYFGFWKVK